MDSEQANTAKNSEDNVNKAMRLFAEYQDFIQGVLGYFISDPDEQEDAYQDLFVYFIRKPAPDDVVHVKAWLYKTILNHIRDRKRRQLRYAALIQTYGQDRLDNDKEGQSQRPAVDPARMDALYSLIRHHLPSKEAKAMLYRYKDHMSVQDIARKMKVKSTSVSHYLAVGLSKLKGLLNKDDT